MTIEAHAWRTALLDTTRYKNREAQAKTLQWPDSHRETSIDGMTRARHSWRGSLRALLVGIVAAALAVGLMSVLGIYDELVIIVAALAAVLLEALIHGRLGRFKRWRRRHD